MTDRQTDADMVNKYERDIAALREEYDAFRQHVSDTARIVVDACRYEVEFPALERLIIPEPIDPDLIEARECVALTWEEDGLPLTAEDARKGKYDKTIVVQIALIAIKRSKGQ